jgi:hypothetical protein
LPFIISHIVNLYPYMLLTTPTITPISQHGFAQVCLNTVNQQQELRSLKSFEPGNIIAQFTAAQVLNTPNYLTVQVSNEQHIMLAPSFLQYINHSCSPNVFFNTDTMQLICLQPIAVNDEFRFFYPSTEWSMESPFVCNCAQPNCIGFVAGAKQLSQAVFEQHSFTSFIRNKYLQQQG